MKRIFLLKGLDCPNCSAKIEKEVGELDGVQSSVVNLMKQTLTINVTQTAADTIASQIETIVHSHEPDVEVQEETVMNVTKSYSLKGLDCPNCSAKIEKEVGELDGVQSSVVNLMKQTLTINVAQTAADTIASQIETIVHSHEPDVEVSEIVQESYIPEKKQEANESYNNEDKKLTVRLAWCSNLCHWYGIDCFCESATAYRVSFSHCFLCYSWWRCCMAGCEEHFKGACI